MNKEKKSIDNYSVVDLFCGIGGLTHGFVKEKFNVAAGIDFDNTCEYAFEANNKGAKFLNMSIQDVTSEYLNSLYPEGKEKILIGCAPCQPFSSYTNNGKKDGSKMNLMDEFWRLIDKTDPKIVSMENVTRVRNYDVFKNFVNNLERKNYFVSYKIVHCQKYGIPQSRSRLVLLASKYSKIELIQETHTKENFATVRNAIGDLPSIQDGEIYKKDKLHRARELSEINKKRIEATPLGGSWKDWPEELLLDCHKKETGKSFWSVYGRMKWDEPSPTLTTLCFGLGNGRFGHPEQDRAISIKEAALIQTFPRGYKFVKPKNPVTFGNLGRQIGNAVPVQLGKIIAKSIKKHLLLIK